MNRGCGPRHGDCPHVGSLGGATRRSLGLALLLATRALLLLHSPDAATLDTLGAAFAENRRFEEAITEASRAVALDPVQAQAIRRRIEQYQLGKPWGE